MSEMVFQSVGDIKRFIALVVANLADLSDSCFQDAVAAIKARPDYYNGDLKSDLDRAVKCARRVSVNVRAKIGHDREGEQLMMDVFDRRQEQLRKHIDVLFYQLKQFLDTHRQPDSYFKAKVWLALEMLGLAVVNCDNTLNTMRSRFGIRVREEVQFMLMNDVKRLYEKVVRRILVTDGDYTLDPMHDENITLAYRIIVKRFGDFDELFKAIEEAGKLNGMI